MRLINADEAEKYFYEHLDDNGMIGAMNAIKEMPTIEMKDEPNELAAQIMQHYGAAHQQLKLCEECGELTQAAIKAHEIGADITTDFVGELADVYVLIKQFLATMPTVWHTEFDTMVMFKLRRQLERIDDEHE